MTRERLPDTKMSTKRMALSPVCELPYQKKMAVHGMGKQSNGSTEADSLETRENTDYIGNFGHGNHPIDLEVRDELTTSIFSVDKHHQH